MALKLVPITLRSAAVFIGQYHRHMARSVANGFGLFAVAAARDGDVVAVAVIGRPKSRHLDDGWTAEVTRVCAVEGARNACSMLYAAAWRACRALGYRRAITYTLPEEGGASLRAAGYRMIGEAGGGSWNRENRPRVDRHPTQEKLRWEKA